MDNIYAAMLGLRIFECFGFSLPKGSKRAKIPPKLIKEYQPWEYDRASRNWLHAEHESTLKAYKPRHQSEDLQAFNVDTKLE